MIELCDATGWGHSHTNLSGLHLDPASYNQQYRSTAPGSGSSPLALCWSQDGTQLIMGMGDGSVLAADVVGRSCSWLNVEAVLTDAHTVVVKDYTTEATEETIDFTDRVTDLHIAHGYLVVTTSSQCFVYDGIATSVGPVMLPYDIPKRWAPFVHEESLAVDDRRYVDPSNPCSLCVYDLLSSAGGPSSKGPMVLPHSVEITQVGLSQIGGVADRKLAFLDKNGDLWLTAGYPQYMSIKATGDDRTPKLKAMVSSFQWNDATDMLVGIADQQLITWNYPQCIFTDSQLLNLTVDTMEIPRQSIGESSAGSWGAGDTTVETFIGTPCPLEEALRRSNSHCRVTIPVPSCTSCKRRASGIKAVKLCRYVRVKELWGTLAAMAMRVNDAGNTLETALAAISDVCKMSMLRHAKGQSDPIVKQAEIMLLSRRANEAIQLLVANRKIYRAIKFNIWLHRWEAALDLAVQHRTHVDTVLAYRMRHLEAMKHSENNEKFRRYAAEVPVDWTSVKAKIAREKAEERASGVDTPPIEATTIEHKLPLDFGTYEMKGRSVVDSSLAGMKMEVKQSHRMGTAVNFTFEHDNGAKYHTDDMRVLRVTAGTKVALTHLPASCYYVDSHNGQADESLREAIRPFLGLQWVRMRNLYVCPSSKNRVKVKLKQENGTFGDLMLVQTVQGVGKKELITPGRYLKVVAQAKRFEQLVDMEIEVSKGGPGKQTANITFYHREEGAYSLYNLPLLTYLRSDTQSDEYRRCCYGMKASHSKLSETQTNQFAEVAAAFWKDLAGLAMRSVMVCVEGKGSISFKFLAKGRVAEYETVNLVLDSANLQMFADTAIKESQGDSLFPQLKRRRIDIS
ncbi:Intraflagellar transport protein 80 [Perkinsus olseni]|uniref:Intraflagellar transport protein 80 n=1 Tax=Perkinsus olseni TaxID=32597 RepID=A0A7J6PKQ5_PEROL|nr:Intraflagellar transport protein 80 [Perkinsus olseni]